MGVNKPRSQGKGDGRRDNFKAFTNGMENVQTQEEWSPRGTIFIKKNNRTIVKYV